MPAEKETFVAERAAWLKAAGVFNMWMAALIRSGCACRAEVDCVLDIMLNRLKDGGIIRDADLALESIRKRMTFALFAGICFARPEDAARAGAAGQKPREREAYRLIMENFVLAARGDGFVGVIEFRMASFLEMYEKMPMIHADEKVMERRKKAIEYWQREGRNLVPRI